MPKARKRLVSLDATPYYHCISRCVRRAFLCGKDELTGYSFEHRRQWIVDRIELLSSVFAIDVCAYAVMSNHYHLVLHIDVERSPRWSDREIAVRWLKLFSGPVYIRAWLRGMKLGGYESSRVDDWLETCRKRLSDLSWFMRCLNEPIARLANAEDRCTGRFWEGRFKSQALLDERAILSCMAYVDLNPIRAGIATSVEFSDFTSLQRRMLEAKTHSLMPFAEPMHVDGPQAELSLPFELRDYVELVDWAGRVMMPDKRGTLSAAPPLILIRLGLDSSAMIDYLKAKPDLPIRAFGSAESLASLARSVGVKFLHGMHVTKRLYASAV